MIAVDTLDPHHDEFADPPEIRSQRGNPGNVDEVFLHAAIAMNEQPYDSVVVEDSVPGVQAARAAGMRAFAYAGAPYADRYGLARAGGQLFDDMRTLPGLVLS